MKDTIIKKRFIKYPVKIGYHDGSGKEENNITDANDSSIVRGWGCCYKTGGIQDKNIARIIVNLLNAHQPKFMVKYYEYVDEKSCQQEKS